MQVPETLIGKLKPQVRDQTGVDVAQFATIYDGSVSATHNPTYKNLIYFTSGTLIKTPSGDIPSETLSVGDLVEILDNGDQPIRWIGISKRIAVGDMAPILIRKGTMGNTHDLRVSPEHWMLYTGWQAELLFSKREVLAMAKSLVNDHSIIRVEGGKVEYFHILFDAHEIIFAEGSPSGSFHLGEQSWCALDAAARVEILTLFPQISNGNFSSYGPSVRTSLKPHEGAVLGEYLRDAISEDHDTVGVNRHAHSLAGNDTIIERTQNA